jgi:ribosomal-protein-alanine N-acetyltransferase
MIGRLAPSASAEMAHLEQLGAENPWTQAQLEESLRNPACLAWGERGAAGELLGHLLLSSVEDEAEILTLLVHPTRRRQGLGRALLIYAMQAVAATTWHLEVRGDNPPAISLYEQVGFRTVGRRRGYYRQGQDALLMSWRRECG